MKKLMGTSAIVICLALTGCAENSMYAPPTTTEHNVQLTQEDVSETMALADIDAEFLAAVAEHHRRYSDGSVDVLVTYDPRSYRNTAMKASEAAASISKSLREEGVANVNASILPLKDLGEDAQVSFSYVAYDVSAPQDCNGTLPGLYGDKVEANRDYKLGCSVKTLFAKQVVRPADLRGRGQTDLYTEGQSAANIVNLVRTGAPNASLEGESASGD